MPWEGLLHLLPPDALLHTLQCIFSVHVHTNLWLFGTNLVFTPVHEPLQMFENLSTQSSSRWKECVKEPEGTSNEMSGNVNGPGLLIPLQALVPLAPNWAGTGHSFSQLCTPTQRQADKTGGARAHFSLFLSSQSSALHMGNKAAFLNLMSASCFVFQLLAPPTRLYWLGLMEVVAQSIWRALDWGRQVTEHVCFSCP